jgi:glycosyltransferase involved in cell wall biosynthesis
MSNRKILFFVTEDWCFCSHRLPIARAAQDAGFEVVIVARVNKHRQNIEQEGFRLIHINLIRESRNIFKEIRLISELVKIYKKEKPDIVHHVAVKPVLYGSIAAIIARVPKFINAIAGLGYIFMQEKSLKSVITQNLFKMAYKLAFFSKSSYAIFQNPEDLEMFVKIGVDEKKAELIRGSGVDILKYKPSLEPEGVITIVLGARMLWDKGIGEVVQACEHLYSKGIKFKMLLAGDPDAANPKSIDSKTLKQWNEKGIVKWIGHQEDMSSIISKAHIVTLPSYREGVPLFLIEAAACGHPVVTTNVPGCKEIVCHGKNGLLVPPKDYKALADALYQLIKSPELRKKMGEKGRKMVEEGFSEDIVVRKTMDFYNRILSG